MGKYKLSVILPCFGRPKRTHRMIESIISQNINNWEAFIIGDGCEDFQEMIDSGEAKIFEEQAEKQGNKIHIFNWNQNYGGYGYKAMNYAIENADSDYFIFVANDDIISHNHFKHYLSEIDNTDLDLVMYKTFVCPEAKLRDPEMRYGSIGHSELIIKTSLVKHTVHKSGYGHDFDFINQLLSRSPKMKKAVSQDYTYIVTHIPTIGTCDNID